MIKYVTETKHKNFQEVLNKLIAIAVAG